MKSRIIEVEEVPPGFYGKVMVVAFHEEWAREAKVFDPSMGQPKLLPSLGWGEDHFLVVDLSVGHGAIFHHKVDMDEQLRETEIYFCPMFAYFLRWAATQDLTGIETWPEHLELDGPLNVLRAKSAEGGK